MQEKEEWISAKRALALLTDIMSHKTAVQTICGRAYDGLIKARAERFVQDRHTSDNVDIPAAFWWAGGEAALTQNWTTGDFETWINERIHLKAYSVTFLRANIEKLIPAQPAKKTGATDPTTKAAGGRPKASWSDDLWVEMCRQLYEGDLNPKKQADITKAMSDWLSARGEDAADSTIKERARKLWAVIGKTDGN